MATGFTDKGADAFNKLINSVTAGNEAVSGFMDATAAAPNGELSIAEYMLVNEFGSDDGKIPARPFMAQAFEKNYKRYQGIVEKSLKHIATGKITLDQLLQRLSIEGHNDIKTSIRDGDFKPNSEFTIAKKGSSRPLIQYGTARQSVTFRVRRGNSE